VARFGELLFRFGAVNPGGGDAYRLGQRDFAQGRPQNYRVHSGVYDRSNETEFARLYNDGYREGRDSSGGGGGGTGTPFGGVDETYSGVGQLQIGNRTQQITDVVVRLRPGGVAQFEISGDMPRLSLAGNWTEGNRGQIDVTLRGNGWSGTTGRGTLYLRNNQFQRMDLTGQMNRQNFSLVFREDARGGGVPPPIAGGPSGTSVHRGGIISRASGKGLDVAAQSNTDGASIQQWDYTRRPNQTWRVIDLGNGEVAIIADHSGMALSVQGGSNVNGANIVQREWRNNNNAFQRWRLEQVSGGFYKIVNVASGKSLDVAGQSLENGANVQQWDYANQQNQQFSFDR
ncbi:MAG: RICIN domain-containing protein, partial [Acidobacteriota bacterium]